MTAYPVYHYCVALDEAGAPIVCASHDLRANMCELGEESAPDYAAHTWRRNSYAAGVAAAGMRDARPDDFGAFPLRDDLLTAMCSVVARLCAFYDIPLDPSGISTHAEAALADGYFGAGEGQRWDIARLQPSPAQLETREAALTGDVLRARIRAA